MTNAKISSKFEVAVQAAVRRNQMGEEVVWDVFLAPMPGPEGMDIVALAILSIKAAALGERMVNVVALPLGAMDNEHHVEEAVKGALEDLRAQRSKDLDAPGGPVSHVQGSSLVVPGR